MKPIISAQNLVKRFGAVTAARDVCVDIMPGTISGLIGTNGAGKTTFINMITGYLKPDEGSILLDGHELVGRASRDITRLGIVRSFQIPQLFDALSARENLEIAVAAQGAHGFGSFRMPRQRSLASRADALLAEFGLERFADSACGILPEGIRKLLDIAIALVGSPRVLFLDEPTSGVASEEKFAIMDRVIAAAKHTGVTILFVEHDMEIVRRYSDRVIAFFEGTVLIDDVPARVFKDEKVRTYIIGEETGAGHA